jgi:hypothetical protein
MMTTNRDHGKCAFGGTKISGAFGAVILASLIVLAFLPQGTMAVTYHRGHITRNETWGPSGNPHHVTGNVVVDSGVTLTIQVGASIYFDGYYGLFVEGKLLVATSATTTGQILFTSNQGTPARGDWYGIKFNSSASDQSVVAVARIEWASYALYLDHASPFVINWTTMRNNTYGLYVDHGTPWMSNSTIENSTYDGIHTAGLDSTQRGWPHPPVPPAATTWPVPIYIENSTVRDNGRYGGYFDGSALNISFCEFSGNDWSGIYWLDPNGTVRWSNISFNGDNPGWFNSRDMAGIALVTGTNPLILFSRNPNISHNTMIDNLIGVYAGAGLPEITRNDMVNNSWFGVYTENDYVYINNNTIEGIGNGISSINSYVEIFDNTIEDTVGQWGSVGIGAIKGSTVIIVNNEILNMGYNGVEFCKSSVTIKNSEITGFGHVGIFDGYVTIAGWPACPAAPGPFLLDVQNNTISSDTDGVVAGIYIAMELDDFWIRNNSVNNISSSSAIGIYVETYSAGHIKNNTIVDNDIGVWLTADTLINYNNIFHSVSYGARGTAMPADATKNWWGAGNGPYDGDAHGACGQNLGGGDIVRDDNVEEVDWCTGSSYLLYQAQTGPY